MDEWNLHTCNFCCYRSTSDFFMLKHLEQHIIIIPKMKAFTCVSNAPESYHCEHCGFETDLKVNLNHHLCDLHEEKRDNAVLDCTLKWYKCDKCDFETYSLLVFVKHIYPFNHVIAIDNAHSETRFTWFKCQHCNYKAKQKRNVKIHNLTKHAKPEKINWFECEHCSYKGKRKSYLVTHIKLKHSDPKNIKWFTCEHCSYKTQLKSNLTSHVRTRHGDPKNWFKCEQCPYNSIVKSTLAVHKLIHMDENLKKPRNIL